MTSTFYCRFDWERVVGVWRQLSNFQLFISWREQVTFQWNDNEVRFVLIWFYIYLPYLGDMLTEMDLQRNTHIIPHVHRHYQNKYVGDIFPAWRTMVAGTDLQCKTHFIPHAPSTSGVFKRHYQNKYVGDIFPAWRTMVAETDLQCKTHFFPHASSTSGVFKRHYQSKYVGDIFLSWHNEQ